MAKFSLQSDRVLKGLKWCAYGIILLGALAGVTARLFGHTALQITIGLGLVALGYGLVGGLRIFQGKSTAATEDMLVLAVGWGFFAAMIPLAHVSTWLAFFACGLGILALLLGGL